ncbi:uncharacterized protein THITE_2110024 [Thermothielavioides terrestris NRRL 8126]|uniref:BHLH domain-containing protein n=1 Tax=Thermothielavioides terrestris (strain ATCC 38088 / NRRL 8126) TaxID=578455 RepID=G2QRB0_THETT|nr:uncharacterized protein THITE_2110024 [Thermothielavioides terrestris NRRL 8126]AEO64162.1 hypothetical protein THITE_2110024 [Thermothielavioides terrestris NRRL 8126]
MDSDPLKHLEFFSMTNNQTANPVDQAYLSGTSAQPPSIWDTTGLNLNPGFGVSPSALDLASTSMSPTQRVQSRPILPARGPRTREGHERKRSRLSSDASTPLDSVDYWLNFDKDDGLVSIPEDHEPPRHKVEGKDNVSATSRPTNPEPPSSTRKHDEFIDDDSALDNALSDDDGFSSINLADQLSRIDTAPPQEVPPREGLYSTPLSWERPQPGIRMDSLIGLHSSALNEAEQRRLIAIAMNPGPSMGGLGSNINLNLNLDGPASGMGFGSGLGSGGTIPGPKPVSPPQPTTSHPRPAPPNAPKRQDSASEKGKEKAKSGDRTAHNDIERKYRTNLKDKIAELRDAVPALRAIPEEGGPDDGSRPPRPAKVSKGTVLTKATEYIHHLERRNKQIMQQHRELSRRLQAFEQLLSATARSSYAMPTYSRTLFDPRGFC